MGVITTTAGRVIDLLDAARDLIDTAEPAGSGEEEYFVPSECIEGLRAAVVALQGAK